MPAYPFRTNMVFPILLGVKPHTIRRQRKNRPTRPGDRIQMFTYWRTPRVCKFGESLCVRVEPIVIWPYEMRIVGNIEFSVETLARNDGFSSVNAFFAFFQNTYRKEMLDDFEIIWWDPLRLEVMPGVKMFSAVRMFAVRGTYTPLDRYVYNHERRLR